MKIRLILSAVLIGAAAVVALPFTAAGARHQSSASVTLRDFAIVSPSLKPAVFGKTVLQPGRMTFTFRNAGKNPHNFAILSQSAGGTKFKSPDIAPGKSATMTVNLKPGAYVAVCTIFNGFHIASGMVKPFAVGKIDQNGKWGP